MQLCRIRSGKVQSCDACIVKELLQAKKKPKIAIPVVRRGPSLFISRFSGKILQYISYTIWTGFTGTLGSKFLNSQHVHYKANSTKSTNNHGFMVQLQTCLINKYTLYSIYAACVGLCVCVCTASLTGRNKFLKKNILLLLS